MPSKLHEAPLVVIRDDPSVLLRLIRDASGVEFGSDVVASLVDSDATQAVPIERRADAVILVSNRAGKAVGAFVVEVQRRRDDKKRFSWPLYVASVHSRHRCSCALVVLALNEATARWCRRTISGFQPPHGFVPLVVGPKEIPRVTRLREARRSPLVAVLSAIVHSESAEIEEIAFNAMASVGRLAPDTRDYYTDVVIAVLERDLAMLARLELRMSSGEFEFQSNYFKQRFAEAQAKAQAEGRADGVMAERLESGRRHIRAVLGARGITLTKTGAARLDKCTDAERLDLWLLAAATASKESDLWTKR